jgi:hypothetical protein
MNIIFLIEILLFVKTKKGTVPFLFTICKDIIFLLAMTLSQKGHFPLFVET